jgi:ATP-dependent Clp protease protease subunit
MTRDESDQLLPMAPPTATPFPARGDEEEDDPPEEGQPEKPGMRESRAFVEQALLKNRMLMVTGPIDDALARYVSGRVLVMEAEHPEKPITVFINSPGGSADSGFAIYDMLRFVRCPVRTVVNGLCASAAILVFLAGRKGLRYSLPESRFLIHQPSTYGRGTASDLDITAREILKLRERYNKIIAAETGQPDKRVLEDAARDFWLNAKEALEYGLIAKVLKTHADLDG